ncbi:hypothetical protein CsatA_003965 [Cannabis sativa]
MFNIYVKAVYLFISSYLVYWVLHSVLFFFGMYFYWIYIAGRIFKTLERHKCWSCAGCTNSWDLPALL